MKTGTTAYASARSLVILAVIVSTLVLLRVIHIDADSPVGASWSAGLYVDEGYKTLAARNLLLFGSEKWHPSDTYSGWLHSSPITQGSFYIAFSALGIKPASARIVTIVYFALLLLAYCLIMYRRYTPPVFYLGLLLLGTDATLFTFSRVALFEIPISFFVYLPVMLLSVAGNDRRPSIPAIAAVLAATVVFAYTVKKSVILYLAPVIAACMLLVLLNRKHASTRNTLMMIALAGIPLAAVMYATSGIWSSRITVTPGDYLYTLVENPLLGLSPLIVIAGLLCAVHSLLYQSRVYLGNLYRASLICMVMLSPFLLPLFSYNPLRYYVPFLPASILLTVEWLHTTARYPTDATRGYPGLVAGFLFLALAVAYGMVAAGLNEILRMRNLVPVALLASVLLVIAWKHLATLRNARILAGALLLGSISNSGYFIYKFHRDPVFDAQAMRDRLTGIVGSDEVISGGWAPFLTLGTDIRVIYANNQFNPPRVIREIRPDYFMLSETPVSMRTFRHLLRDEQISAGKPVQLGFYNNTRVKLFPLFYARQGE